MADDTGKKDSVDSGDGESKNSQKKIELQGRLIQLKARELEIKKEIDKLYTEESKKLQDQSKKITEYTKALDDIIKKKKDISKIIKQDFEKQKDSKKQDDAIEKSLKNRLDTQTKIYETKQKEFKLSQKINELYSKTPKGKTKELSDFVNEKAKELALQKEINAQPQAKIKINDVISFVNEKAKELALQKEINAQPQAKIKINDAISFVNQKAKELTLQKEINKTSSDVSKNKELSDLSKIVDKNQKNYKIINDTKNSSISVLNTNSKIVSTLQQQASITKTSSIEDKKNETSTSASLKAKQKPQNINIKTNVDTASLGKGLSLLQAMNQSNEDDLKTILQKNKVLNDGIKKLQQEENTSLAYKKQKTQELSTIVEINKEKLRGLGIDEKSLKSIERNQKKQAKSPQTSISKAAAPTPPPTPPAPPSNVSKQTESNIPTINVDAYEQGLEAAKGLAEMAKEKAKYDGYANENQKQNIKILDKSIQQRESIQSSIEAALEESQDVEGIEKLISKNVQSRVFAQNRLNEFLKTSNIDITETDSLMKDIEHAMKDQVSAEKAISELKTKTSFEERSRYDTLVSQGVSYKEITAEMGIGTAESVKSLRTAEDAADKASIKVEKLKQIVSIEQAEYIALKKSIGEYSKIEQSLIKQDAYQKSINEKLGIFGKTVKGIGGLLEKFGVGKVQSITDALDAMRTKAQQGGNKLQVMGAGLLSFGKSLVKALNDPVVVIGGLITMFTALVKSALAFQSRTFEFAKTLGVSVNQAGLLRKEFEHAANANGKLGLTSKDILATYSEMSNTLGIMAPTNQEFLQTSTMLQKRIGASAESMLELQTYAAKSGKSMMQAYGSVVGTGKAMAAQLKINMSEKQILDGISKVSATIYNNFKGNLPALAKAVVESKKMGLELNKIQSMGNNLLDFENSISKEFEAQLLTGEKLNLSKAREFALAGDTNGLMNELKNNMMGQEKWGRMNVIQQQSYAEALGMSKEEMDEMFRTQKMQNALGEKANDSYADQYNTLVKQGKSFSEISEIIGKDAANQASQASVQEKMAATMERVKDAIGEATSKILPLIEKVANFISTIDIEKAINNIIKAAAVLSGIYTAWKVIQMFSVMAKTKEAAVQKKITTELQQQQLLYYEKANLEKQSMAAAQAQATTQTGINQSKQTGVAIAGQQNVVEQTTTGLKQTALVTEEAQLGVKEIGVATSISQEVVDGSIAGIKATQVGEEIALEAAKTTGLGVSVTQDVKDKSISITKKIQLGMERLLGISKKTSLATTKVMDVTEKTTLATKRTASVTADILGGKEKKNAGISIAGAIAKVTGGSGFLGPGALAIGGLAATMLFGYLASVGGGGGGGEGGGGGSVGEAASPQITSDAGAAASPAVKPMNAAAENKKIILEGNALTRENPSDKKVNVITNITLDAITAASVVKLVDRDHSANGDQNKVSARTK